MSDPTQPKKSHLLKPFKGLFSSKSHSHQSITPQNKTDSISQVVSPTTQNDATSASKPEVNLNPQGTEYTAILELSTTPSGPLTWDHRMKDWGSTAYEGLKIAIQGIYDCSGLFPPLQTTAGVLLTICKVVDVCASGSCAQYVNTLLTFPFTRQRVSANSTDLEQLGVKLQSILSIIRKYRNNGGLHALDDRVEKFCLYVGSSFCLCQCLFDAPGSSSGPSILK